ncbi:hypothetical protein [Motilibacter deserti]|uniref:Dolichyl-phosphate-mannose-protein mannosyltransferase n=1 Tax=Motilibacter deserti TaxID=2714956 RepID=A0ABX0H0B2_9ACTN|nr:hypothetical protein [Motilibacter deserti]NHC15346.1 hypothetical protein [Motilibacter deserti]
MTRGPAGSTAGSATSGPGHAGRPVRSWAPATLAIALVSATLGAVYVGLVPRGLPYDEPSHWLNVMHIAEDWTLPRLGQPDVTYQAQQGPLAYALGAVVLAVTRWIAGDLAGFYAVRTLGLAELLALGAVTASLVTRALPRARWAFPVAFGFVTLNPMMLAMSTSVQNDTLSLLLAALALHVGLVPAAARNPGRAAVAGALAGLAILAKVTAFPVAVVLLAVWAWRREWRAVAASVVALAVVTGWWFLRNLDLYGDLTGEKAIEEAGYPFDPVSAAPIPLARNVITYLWLPTEYYRNLIVSPTALDALAVLLTVAGLAGGVLALARLRTVRDWAAESRLLMGAVLATAAIAFVAYVYTTTQVRVVALRFAYVGWTGWALVYVAAFGLLAGRRLRGAALAAGAVVLLALSGWVLISVAQDAPDVSPDWPGVSSSASR